MPLPTDKQVEAKPQPDFRFHESRKPDVHPPRLGPTPPASHSNPRIADRTGTSWLCQAKSRNRIYATSDSLIRIAVDNYKNSDEMGQKAKSLLYLGDVLMDMERYADATLPLKQAEELMEHVPDRQMQTMIYSNFGFLNRKAGNYELAFSYYKKALAINRAN